MQAASVIVQTERDQTPNDVLVRAIASEASLMDGKPVAGFFTRRRYHGDTFYISDAKEFSARWMEFVDAPPTKWIEVIKSKYPEFSLDSRFEQAVKDRNEAMNRDQVTNKISSTDFDYSNGAPRKRGRPRKVQ